jgi:hypothetical protein
MSSRFKVAFCWWPKRLALKDESGMRWVGWIWLQRAYLVNNINHGWIAFVDGQTKENLMTCPCCGRTTNSTTVPDGDG